MSDLRRRAKIEEKLEGKPSDAPGAQSPIHTPGRGGRVLTVLIFVSLVGVTWILSRSGSVSSQESYALCSRDGAKIYTVDEHDYKVQCIVVHGHLIVDRGTLSEVQNRWQTIPLLSGSTGQDQGGAKQPALQIRYLKPQAVVVPGLSDSHAHILEYGAYRTMPLEPAKSIEAAVAVVKEYIQSNPEILNNPNKTIEGWGWDHTIWPTKRWPTAADLEADPIIRGRFVILHSKDGHAIWVSSKAIEASPPLPDAVDGGYIVRDDQGMPSGVFVDNAQDFIRRPQVTDDTLKKRFTTTVTDAVSVGLTSIHDAGLDPVSLEFFKRQSEQGHLPIRVYGMTFYDENAEYWGNTTKPILSNGDGMLNVRSVKMFADGALRTGGAALNEPYSDNPNTRGLMRISPEVLKTVIPRFMKDNWQVNVHAIGDRANSIVLDAFEEGLKSANVTALRPRLEHAQLLSQSDIKRVPKLGGEHFVLDLMSERGESTLFAVIASVQPTHATSDMWYAEDRLGPERVKGLYAFRSLIDNGAKLTFGSDFPVEDINPLAGFYAAVTRLSRTGQSPHGPRGWFPEQCVTRQEALRAMTIVPAYASFSESILGSIETGKRADFVILNKDIMTVPVEAILETRVLATVIDGKAVYGQF